MRRLALATAGLSLIASACSAPPPPHTKDDGTVVLKLGDTFSATHAFSVGGTIPFMEVLEEKGPEVGLEVDYYSSQTLAKHRDTAAAMRTGVYQMGPVVPSYVGTQLPLSTVGDLPGMAEGSCRGSDAIMETLKEGGTVFEEELEPAGIRVLFVGLLNRYEAMTSTKQVIEPKDLEGQVLRTTGGATDRLVDHTGAAGVSMALSDLYEAISQGTADGTFVSAASVAPYRLSEVLRYSTHGANLGAVTVTFAISEETWDSLNEEQQAVITEASAVAQERVCHAIEEENDKQLVVMEEDGVEFHEVTPAELEVWESYFEPVQEEWVRDLKKIDRPADVVYEEFAANLEEAEDR